MPPQTALCLILVAQHFASPPIGGLLVTSSVDSFFDEQKPWLTQNFAQWRQDRTWLTQVS